MIIGNMLLNSDSDIMKINYDSNVNSDSNIYNE